MSWPCPVFPDSSSQFAPLWQVELVIRRMRQHLSLDEMTSQNEEMVEALLWASLCGLALVGALHQRLWPEARAEKVGRELVLSPNNRRTGPSA